MLIKVLCLNCNQEFEANSSEIKKGYGKFCCRSCAASYNNRKFPKRNSKKNCKSKICQTCKTAFTPRNNALCCCRDCSEKYYRTLRYKQIEERGYFYTKEQTGSSSTVRNYLINKYGNNCMLCGQSANDWKGKPLTLIVDHIDGDAHNWTIENIQIICPNCDSQLSTFKGRNVGKSTRKYTITQK